MDLMLRGNNPNSIQRELESVINGPIGHDDIEVFLYFREDSSQDNEIGDIKTGNEAPGPDRLFQSLEILSSKMNIRQKRT